LKLIEETQQLRHTVSDLSLAADDLIIPWNELVLKEKIGAGSFGTVHRADWHGSVSFCMVYLSITISCN